jgi:multimeric flavodoxin WrbA
MSVAEVKSMNEKRRILAINGSYRDGGISDQAIASVIENLERPGVDIEHLKLREFPIEFCLNCRQCMQQPGDAPGKCVLNDRMAELVEKIEAADAYVLAAPTNFSSVTALFKRFAERLAVYGYWPWGKAAPVFRKAKMRKKPAIIISSCAAPGLMGRLTYNTNKSLKIAADTIGAKVVGSMVVGLISQESKPDLPARTRRRAKALAPRLAA